MLSAAQTGSCCADEGYFRGSYVASRCQKYGPTSLCFGITGKRRYFILKKENDIKKEKRKTRNFSSKLKLICLSGIMAAIYVGLDFLAVSVSAPFGGTLKISLSGLPVIIVAIFGGPIWGAATGFIGSLLGQMLNYGFSATTVLWILPAVMRGLSMGILFKVFKRSLKPSKLIIETCISSVIVTLFNTLAMLVDQYAYGYYNSYIAIYAAIPARIFAGVVTAVIFSLMLPTIITSLNKGKGTV